MIYEEFRHMAPHGGLPTPQTSPLLGAVISGSPSDKRVNRLQNAHGFLRISPYSVPVKDHTSGRSKLKGGTGFAVPVSPTFFKGDQT